LNATSNPVSCGARRGTPQGGVASQLLANIYMNRFLKYWRMTGCGQAFRAHVIAYADDFVILSRRYAAEALAWTRSAMTRLGLTLNETKTSLKNARQERDGLALRYQWPFAL
jgi:RNA-directed DNA polymerase